MTHSTAAHLAALRKPLPGETPGYGKVRQELLAEEIEPASLLTTKGPNDATLAATKMFAH